MYLWHRIVHSLKPGLWVDIEQLGAHLRRQQCRQCYAIRIREVR